MINLTQTIVIPYALIFMSFSLRTRRPTDLFISNLLSIYLFPLSATTLYHALGVKNAR